MKVVLIYSGGLDSTALLYNLLSEGIEVKCLSVNYGQRHRRELDAARSICERLDIEHRVADLSSIAPLIAASSQTGSISVPEGHYSEESMKQTVVPNRNMIMLSLAIGWAITLRFDAVAYAAHAGDHTIYPDCRAEFVEAMRAVAAHCDWYRVELLAPFINLSKADIARLGYELNIPAGDTWSCYKGLKTHCGRCGTCVERREAFALACVEDPTEYADSDFYLTATVAHAE